MRTLDRATDLMRHPSHAFSGPHKLKHPVWDALGLVLIAFGAVIFASMLPDIRRYLKMRQM